MNELIDQIEDLAVGMHPVTRKSVAGEPVLEDIQIVRLLMRTAMWMRSASAASQTTQALRAQLQEAQAAAEYYLGVVQGTVPNANEIILQAREAVAAQQQSPKQDTAVAPGTTEDGCDDPWVADAKASAADDGAESIEVRPQEDPTAATATPAAEQPSQTPAEPQAVQAPQTPATERSHSLSKPGARSGAAWIVHEDAYLRRSLYTSKPSLDLLMEILAKLRRSDTEVFERLVKLQLYATVDDAREAFFDSLRASRESEPEPDSAGMFVQDEYPDMTGLEPR